jgi:hypothetical protein
LKKTYSRSNLEPVNEEELDDQVKAKRFETVYAPLLRLLSQACDLAAGGTNTWISIGKTQAGDALVLAVHTPDGKLACYGPTLGGLAMGASDLL